MPPDRSDADRALLIDRIRRSFPGTGKPAMTRSVCEHLDEHWVIADAEKWEALRSQDPEEAWTDLTAEALDDRCYVWSYGDAESWEFHLPAYMIHYLSGHRGNDDVYWGIVTYPTPGGA